METILKVVWDDGEMQCYTEIIPAKGSLFAAYSTRDDNGNYLLEQRKVVEGRVKDVKYTYCQRGKNSNDYSIQMYVRIYLEVSKEGGD